MYPSGLKTNKQKVIIKQQAIYLYKCNNLKEQWDFNVEVCSENQL